MSNTPPPPITTYWTTADRAFFIDRVKAGCININDTTYHATLHNASPHMPVKGDVSVYIKITNENNQLHAFLEFAANDKPRIRLQQSPHWPTLIRQLLQGEMHATGETTLPHPSILHQHETTPIRFFIHTTTKTLTLIPPVVICKTHPSRRAWPHVAAVP